MYPIKLNAFFYWLLLVIFMLNEPMPVSAQQNPALLALPDGVWTALPNTAINDVSGMDIGCCDYTLGCDHSGIFSYSGATLDTQGQRIILWGGGHNDYFGNQLLIFDIASLQWQMQTQPTSVCFFNDTPDYQFTNGLPVSRHTYDHIGYINHLDVFFAFSGATADAPPFNNGTSYGDAWTYAFNGAGWVDRTPGLSGDQGFRLAEPGASGEYDPLTQAWFQISQYGIWRLDFNNYRWTQLSETGHPGIERVSVLDTQRRLIWTYGGDYGGDARLSSYAIDSNTFTIVSEQNLPGATSGAGLVYDSANDQLVLFGNGQSNSVFNYDIGQGVWTEFASNNGPPATRRLYGRFQYDAINNVFFLIDSMETVWVWKNQLGSNLPDIIFEDGFEEMLSVQESM
ncbi:hypothetical protein [Marinicella sp. W31]|uniref:hypothetical protein n=1 Tax=Marinicella sp. W31 TaxID=3023713 RepID=UPI003757C64D